MSLVIGNELPKIIVGELHLVHHVSAADAGIVVGSEGLAETSHVVRRSDTANCAVNAGTKRRDAVLRLPTKFVVVIDVNRPVLFPSPRQFSAVCRESKQAVRPSCPLRFLLPKPCSHNGGLGF